MFKIIRLTITALWVLTTTLALGDENMEVVESDKWYFSIAVGAGIFENPLTEMDDSNIPVLPTVNYYGDRFWMSNLNLGYALFENDYFAIDLEGLLNEDGIYYQPRDLNGTLLAASIFGNAAPSRGPRSIPESELDRNLAYLTGLSVTVPYSFGELYIGYFHDAFNTKNGYESHVSLSGRYTLDNWYFRTEIGAIYKSVELVDYYYSLDVRYDSLLFPGRFFVTDLYVPEEAATNTYLMLQAEREINENWSFIFNAKATKLDTSIFDSPMVDQDKTVTAFAGIKYRF